MIIDCVGCMHGSFPNLEGGDLLIIAGDMTARDTVGCWDKFFTWLDVQEYRKKLYIGGNHDNFLTKCCNNVNCADISYGPECEKQEYLQDSGIEFEGLKIWGSPWSLLFEGVNPHCKSFMCSESDLKKKYDLIPSDIDILITHGPPYGILDECKNGNVGSLSLKDTLNRIKPKLLVFSHIHEEGGKQMLYKHQGPNTLCVNASIMNENYKPVNKPVRIIL